jgi:hypothetical protein
MIGKNAGKRNTEKEKNFFKWQVLNPPTQGVFITKPPYTLGSENNIPDDKTESRNGIGFK